MFNPNIPMLFQAIPTYKARKVELVPATMLKTSRVKGKPQPQSSADREVIPC